MAAEPTKHGLIDDPFAAPPSARDPFTIRAVARPYATPWLSIEHRDVVRPDGADGVYGIVRIAQSAVGVLAVTERGEVTLVGQWRVPLGRYSWELPEGGCPADEDPLAAAQRELAEETGLRAASWMQILSYDVSNCLTDETAIAFLAWNLRAGEASPDGTEVLERRVVHFTTLLEGIERGAIRDGLTIATVLRAHQMALAGRLPEALARAMLQGA